MKLVHETQPFGLRKLPYGLLKDNGELVYATVYQTVRVIFDGCTSYRVITVTLREIEGESVKTVLRVENHGNVRLLSKATQIANDRYQLSVRALSVPLMVSQEAYHEEMRDAL